MYSAVSTIIGEQLTDLASQARKAGFAITLKSDNFNHIIAVYNDSTSPKTINDWPMVDYGGDTDSTYPTTFGVFDTTGTGNSGSYSDPQADKLINGSVTSGSAGAVKNEASFLTAQQPSLFQPDPDYIAVWKNIVSGQPAAFESLTQYQLNPEQMYLTN